MSDVETADRLSRRRARTLPMLAIIFVAQQASYVASAAEGARTVDHVKISAWLVLSIVMLLALATGGFWFQPAPVRALLDDEGTRANRTDALRMGFLATMAAGIAVYIVCLFEPLGGRDAVHAIMTVGIAAALIRFGVLEKRAHRDG